IEWMIHRRVPDWVWLVSTLLVVIGCFLLFQSNVDVSFNPIGMLFSLGAGITFAVYTFVSKALVEQHAPDVVVAIVFSIAALFLLPFLFFTNINWVFELSGMFTIL